MLWNKLRRVIRVPLMFWIHCLYLAEFIVCLVVQMELPSWKAVRCRQVALRRTPDSGKRPSRWATKHKSCHNSTIKPLIQNPPISFQDNVALSLHCTFQNLIFSGREEWALERFLRKHTQTHDDYCMPQGSAHRGLIIYSIGMSTSDKVSVNANLLMVHINTCFWEKEIVDVSLTHISVPYQLYLTTDMLVT